MTAIISSKVAPSGRLSREVSFACLLFCEQWGGMGLLTAFRRAWLFGITDARDADPMVSRFFVAADFTGLGCNFLLDRGFLLVSTHHRGADP